MKNVGVRLWEAAKAIILCLGYAYAVVAGTLFLAAMLMIPIGFVLIGSWAIFGDAAFGLIFTILVVLIISLPAK